MRFIDYLKSLSKKNNYTEWEWNRGFSISVGETTTFAWSIGETECWTNWFISEKEWLRNNKLNELGI